MSELKSVYLYRICLKKQGIPTLFYFGIRQSPYENPEDDPYMGTPITFKDLWEDPTYTKTKTILASRSHSTPNVLEMKAREAIIIQEAWKKYGGKLNISEANAFTRKDLYFKRRKIGRAHV